MDGTGQVKMASLVPLEDAVQSVCRPVMFENSWTKCTSTVIVAGADAAEPLLVTVTSTVAPPRLADCVVIDVAMSGGATTDVPDTSNVTACVTLFPSTNEAFIVDACEPSTDP